MQITYTIVIIIFVNYKTAMMSENQCVCSTELPQSCENTTYHLSLLTEIIWKNL